MNSCLIIIPAFNEEQNIGKVITEIKGLELAVDILIVNDGSSDCTKEVVCSAKTELLNLPYNLGYGGALQTGFKYAVRKGYPYVITFDADGQHDPRDIPVILQLLQRYKSDIVIGSRFLGRGNFHTGILKKTAILIFRSIIRLSTGTSITDPSSGLQGLSRRVYTYYATMGNYPVDYPDADILIQMLLNKYNVLEFPANIRARNFGSSMHQGLRPLFYFAKMLVSILVVLLRPKKTVEE